jgi:hypothetical protein
MCECEYQKMRYSFMKDAYLFDVAKQKKDSKRKAE